MLTLKMMRRMRTWSSWTAPPGSVPSVPELSRPNGREKITLQLTEPCPEVWRVWCVEEPIKTDSFLPSIWVTNTRNRSLELFLKNKNLSDEEQICGKYSEHLMPGTFKVELVKVSWFQVVLSSFVYETVEHLRSRLEPWNSFPYKTCEWKFINDVILPRAWARLIMTLLYWTQFLQT